MDHTMTNSLPLILAQEERQKLPSLVLPLHPPLPPWLKQINCPSALNGYGLFDTNISISWTFFQNVHFIKQDGVGPVDNGPTTD